MAVCGINVLIKDMQRHLDSSQLKLSPYVLIYHYIKHSRKTFTFHLTLIYLCKSTWLPLQRVLVMHIYVKTIDILYFIIYFIYALRRVLSMLVNKPYM
jgi:hypothetical protein